MKEVSCSFCDKPKSEVGYLVAGPTAFICNECVEICRLIGQTMAQYDATTIMQAALTRDGAASLELYRRVNPG